MKQIINKSVGLVIKKNYGFPTNFKKSIQYENYFKLRKISARNISHVVFSSYGLFILRGHNCS